MHSRMGAHCKITSLSYGAIELMTLHRSDYDQAARYLRYASELLGRQAFGRTVTLREVLEMAARR